MLIAKGVVDVTLNKWSSWRICLTEFSKI